VIEAEAQSAARVARSDRWGSPCVTGIACRCGCWSRDRGDVARMRARTIIRIRRRCLRARAQRQDLRKRGTTGSTVTEATTSCRPVRDRRVACGRTRRRIADGRTSRKDCEVVKGLPSRSSASPPVDNSGLYIALGASAAAAQARASLEGLGQSLFRYCFEWAAVTRLENSRGREHHHRSSHASGTRSRQPYRWVADTLG